MNAPHPMVTRLLERRGGDLLDAVEAEADDLYSRYRDDLYFKKQEAKRLLDVRALAAFMRMQERHLNRPTRGCWGGTTREDGQLYYAVSPDERGRLPHIFQQRFIIAHEIAHVFLRTSLGPWQPGQLIHSREEETLCDLFALALLAPPSQMPDPSQDLDRDAVYALSRHLMLPVRRVLERLAWRWQCFLILWDHCVNPKHKGGPAADRITGMWPMGRLFNRYVPLFCTPKDERFQPNLVAQSLGSGSSNQGLVTIQNLGSLDGEKWVRTIFFKDWSQNLFQTDISGPGRRFKAASLISSPH